MTDRPDDDEASRKHAYEHVLRSIISARDVLAACCADIEDIDLDAARNTRDINLVLHWVYDITNEVYERYPEFAPPKAAPPQARRPAVHEAGRDEVLSRVYHQLELASLILQECGPFASAVGIVSPGLAEHLAKIEGMHKAVTQEIWKDLPDERKRGWIRDRGMPDGVTEPPSADRPKALGRLDEKLKTAAKVLDDCAPLIVDLELEPMIHLHAIGSCLVTIYDIQRQIWEERPDLVPGFLKRSLELKSQEETGGGD